MGLFSPRPEEPTEWAGLPSEPLPTRSEAESLAATVESADSLSLLGAPTESVVISVVPFVEAAPPPAEPAEGDATE